MILGKIVGKISTTKFQFKVSSQKAKKFDFIQVNHLNYGFVLCQIVEMIRSSEGMNATCQVIGYKDSEGKIKGIRTPFNVGSEVLEAEDDFIKKIIELDGTSGYIGNLESKNINVKVDLQKVLTKHLSILAKSGAGKSYTVGVLVEEIIDLGIPLLIIDPHGEYSSLKEASQTSFEELEKWGIKAKGYSSIIQEFGDFTSNENLLPLKLREKMSSHELMKLLPLSLTNTQEAMLFSVIKDLEIINFDNIILGLEGLNSFNTWSIVDMITYLKELQLFSISPTPLNEIITPGKCSIINLKGIEPQIQGTIVAALLKDLFMARKQAKIPPFFCVIEEAHNFVPEKGFGNAKSSEIIRLISSEGRKFGLGLCVVSQRPALVQKTVLSQCSTQIIMKITNPNDLRVISNSVEGISTESVDEIQNLPVGSAMVCGVVDRPLIVNIRQRKTKHGGNAINILSSNEKYSSKENEKGENEKTGESKEVVGEEINFVEESEKISKKNLFSLIKPKLSIKEIKLVSNREIKTILTYLIPAIYVTCKNSLGDNFPALIDKIKGNVIIDPDKDLNVELEELDESKAFYQKPVFENIEFDEKLNEKISTESLINNIKEKVGVENFQECFIVFNKVEYV